MAEEQRQGAPILATPPNPLAPATVALVRERFAEALIEVVEHRGETTILLAPEAIVRRRDLVAFSKVDIASAGARHRTPLRRDVEQLAAALSSADTIVLLGSIATGKYADTLVDVFGERLLFPTEFVGRGDMSRGGLLLRHVRAQQELEYRPIVGAVRHGKRPPKLVPLARSV